MPVRKLSRGVLPSKSAQKNIQATVNLSTSTPIAAALRSIDRKLPKGKVRVLGMGRAIQVALQVAAALKSRCYSVEIRTQSITVVDELVDEMKGKSTMKNRMVPAVELIVRAPKLS